MMHYRIIENGLGNFVVQCSLDGKDSNWTNIGDEYQTLKEARMTRDRCIVHDGRKEKASQVKRVVE
jgi:hypothetical protein